MTEGTLLVIDTATRTPVVALAERSGKLIGEQRWQSRHRHGEELLDRIDRLLADTGTARSDLGGVVVGTGPGSFTGLRIGLATAKTIAYSLGIPLVGTSTSLALAHAAWLAEPALTEVVVTLPAGAVDRYEDSIQFGDSGPSQVGTAQLVAGPPSASKWLIAIDLEAPLVSQAATVRGGRALDGLAASLAMLGAQRLTSGDSDDPAELVPAYVALPRGIARAAAEMEWSPDLR